MIDEAEALLRRSSSHPGLNRPVSVRRRVAVGACLSLPRGSRQLGRGGAAVRRTASPLAGLTGGRHQSRPLAIAEVHGAGAPLDGHARVSRAMGRLAEYQPYWAARAELLA